MSATDVTPGSGLTGAAPAASAKSAAAAASDKPKKPEDLRAKIDVAPDDEGGASSGFFHVGMVPADLGEPTIVDGPQGAEVTKREIVRGITEVKVTVPGDFTGSVTVGGVERP